MIEAGAGDREMAAAPGVAEVGEPVAAGLAAGGRAALASRGRAGPVQAAAAQLRELEAVLDAGPAVSGWVRISAGRWPGSPTWSPRFRVQYTLAGLDLLHHRGWSAARGPAGGRAGRGADRRVAGGDLAGGKRTAADLGAWLCFEDEIRPGPEAAVGRTWGRRGRTPVVTVTGGSNKRVSLAALIAVRPGQRPRLIYRMHRARRRTGAKASPRRSTPGCWTPRTSSSAARSCWSGTT